MSDPFIDLLSPAIKDLNIKLEPEVIKQDEPQTTPPAAATPNPQEKKKKEKKRNFSQLIRVTTQSEEAKDPAYWDANWKEFFDTEPMEDAGELVTHGNNVYLLFRFESKLCPKVFYDKFKQKFGTTKKYDIARSKSATIKSILEKSK